MSDTIVQLSDETIQVLKTAVSVNPCIIIRKGNIIGSISGGGDIILQAEVGESFPEEMHILDLQRFNQIISILDKPELIFNGNGAYFIVKSGETQVKCHYDVIKENFKIQQQEIRVPDTLPNANAKFVLTESQLASAQRMASVMRQQYIQFLIENKRLYITTVTTTMNPVDSSVLDNTDTYKSFICDIDLDDANIVFKLENMILPKGDYDVELAYSNPRKKIGLFKNRSRKVLMVIGANNIS